jgi:hypothetical protein
MDGSNLNITIHHRGEPVAILLPKDSTLQDLSIYISQHLNVPPSHQKYLGIPGVSGMLKPPFDDATLSAHPLSDLVPDPSSSKKIKVTLLGAYATDVANLLTNISHGAKQLQPKPFAAKATVTGNPHAKEDAKYTFHDIQPLNWLPKPERSKEFLERLARDPGIRAAMRHYKFNVGLLTEMDPTMHTTSESRTLGLNRNAGEVIELRLRTDAYDGYRDYKTIRKTLCHELTHNVWGDHDQNFWKMCKEIEKLVEREDWTRGGRSTGGGVHYEPLSGQEEEHVDGGGWKGGDYVVGRNPNSAGGEDVGLTRREVIARAAERRLLMQQESKEKKLKPQDDQADNAQ